MRRVVLDVNVYVSALLAPAGSPARVLGLWTDSRFDVIVSPLLLVELQRVLRRAKLRSSISTAEVDGLLSALAEEGIEVADPKPQTGVTTDPGDDYLVALARASEADLIVSGDTHLTELSDPVSPVLTPREFLNIV